jgi:uncharacterized protein YlxW (UPF0749 family)
MEETTITMTQGELHAQFELAMRAGKDEHEAKVTPLVLKLRDSAERIRTESRVLRAENRVLQQTNERLNAEITTLQRHLRRVRTRVGNIAEDGAIWREQLEEAGITPAGTFGPTQDTDVSSTSG